MTTEHKPTVQSDAPGRTDQPHRLLRVEEAADLLQLSKSYLYGEIQRGKISCVRFGRAVRLEFEEVMRFKETNKHPSDRNLVLGGAK